MFESDSREFEQQFASDNYAGICPEALQAMEAANRGHVTSYGDDPWTAKASDAFRDLFETDCEVYLSSTVRPPTHWRWRRCASRITA